MAALVSTKLLGNRFSRMVNKLLTIQKKIRLGLFSCLCFCCATTSSAALGVNFTERAYFYEDGSGLFSLEVDLTKSAKLIAFLKYLNKSYQDIPKLIAYNPLCTLQKTLNPITGITGIIVKDDKKSMLRFKLKFGFKDIEALNKAMIKINEGLDPPEITYFNFSNELFVREDLNGIVKKLIDYQNHSNCLIKSFDLASFFKHTTYTTIYTFHKMIKNYSNPLGELSMDKKTIRITHYVFAADEIEDSIGNRCHFDTSQH
ncbi:MAG: hypothetical protein NQ127_02605 [Candidatus Cardinium sp.]|nr:hypothetical protein [Candidatus Cardinium sp.]